MISGTQIPKISHYSGCPAAAGNTNATIFTTSTRCKFAVLNISTSHAAQGGFIWKTANALTNFLCGNHAGSNVAGVSYARVVLPANTVVGYFSNNTSQLAYQISVEEYF